MALSADRFLDMAKPGYRIVLPVSAAATFYHGAACIYLATDGEVGLQGGARGTFAGFVDRQNPNAEQTPASGEIALRVPERVWLPLSTAVRTMRGQAVELVTDDEVIATRAMGAAVTANSSQLGVCIDVKVGEALLVEIDRNWVEA